MPKVMLLLLATLLSAAVQAQAMPAPPPDAEVDPLTTGIEWASATGDDYKLVVVPVYDAQGKHVANDLALSINGDPPVTTRHWVNPTTPIPITWELAFYIGSMTADTMDLRSVNPAQPGIIILGLSGNDLIVGSSRGDMICAGAGDDVVFDFGGPDVIFGNAGNDALFGGPGADFIYGNGDDDNRAFPRDPANGNIVTTKSGLVGGSEDDTILGGPGNERMFGEEGNDNIVCNDAGPSNRDLHYVVGGAGDDHIWGCSDDSRRDRIWGDDPSDPTIQGADRIDTGKGPDHVDGGPLSDEIFVGDVALATFSNGTMTIIGGLGADYIQLKSAWGFVYGDRVGDAVNGDADTIDVLGGHASKGYRMWLGGGNDQILNGGPGNDQIYGENGSDISLRGGEGNDGISGGEGSDDILGGNGEDFLVGDDGSDIINGEDMADKLYDFSSQYVDTLRGGDGDDRLFCNDNQQQNPDFNFGEAGNDTFEFDDIDAVVPQTDALSPPESTTVLPPTPDIIVALQVVVGW